MSCNFVHGGKRVGYRFTCDGGCGAWLEYSFEEKGERGQLEERDPLIRLFGEVGWRMGGSSFARVHYCPTCPSALVRPPPSDGADIGSDVHGRSSAAGAGAIPSRTTNR